MIHQELNEYMNLNILLALEKRKHVRWALKDSASRGLGLMSVILFLYVGFAESVGSSPTWNQVDKVVHFMIFAGFTMMFLQYARFKVLTNLRTDLRLFLIFMLLASMGVIAELTHLIVPHRTFEWNDMVANLAGTLSVGIPMIIIAPFRRKSDQFTCFQESDSFRKGGQQSLKVRHRARHG